MKSIVSGILTMLLSSCPLFAQTQSWLTVDNLVVSNQMTQVNPQGTNVFIGKVGIGTNEPGAQLDVAGDVRISGAMVIPRQGDVGMGDYTNGASTGGVTPGSGSCFWATNTAGEIYILKKVGIGTNAPSVALEVAGAIKAWGDIEVVSNLVVNGSIAGRGTMDMGTNLISNLLDPVAGQDAATKNWVSNNYVSAGWVDANYLSRAETNQLVLTNDQRVISLPGLNQLSNVWVNGSGNIGMGTSNPSHSLDVNGAICSRTNGFIFPDGSTQTTASATGSGYVQVQLTTNYTLFNLVTGWNITPTNQGAIIDGDWTTTWSDAKLNASKSVSLMWDLGSVITGRLFLVINCYGSAVVYPLASYNDTNMFSQISGATSLTFRPEGGSQRWSSEASSWANTYTQVIFLPFAGRYVGCQCTSGSSAASYFRLYEIEVWKEN